MYCGGECFYAAQQVQVFVYNSDGWLVVEMVLAIDEIGALVGDIGFGNSKFGYAGEDFPKAVVPSVSVES